MHPLQWWVLRLTVRPTVLLAPLPDPPYAPLLIPLAPEGMPQATRHHRQWGKHE